MAADADVWSSLFVQGSRAVNDGSAIVDTETIVRDRHGHCCAIGEPQSRCILRVRCII